MTAIPDSTLSWLYAQLTNEYTDPRRTYSDVVEALSAYRTLKPRTDIYTYETGQHSLLLHITGNIPVQFRGVVYRFPIAIWVPYAYPREAPMMYVEPSQDMLVKPGQHVSGDGRIYHPYLAQWGQHWDRSSLSDFLTVLRGVFAKEPPVISKQHAQVGPPLASQPIPPPVPPPPVELRGSERPSPQPTTGGAQPPPRPPKPYEPSVPSLLGTGSAPVPPPKPYQTQQAVVGGTQQPMWQQGQSLPQHNQQYLQPQQQQEAISQRQASLSQPPRPHIQPQYHQSVQQANGFDSPVSPMTPLAPPRGAVPQYNHQQALPQQQQAYARQSHHGAYAVHAMQNMGPPGQQAAPGATQQYYPPQQYQKPLQERPQPQQLPKPKQPIPDLLDAPLDVALPSQTPIPAPPIPPNPEKDALLRAISAAVVMQICTTVQSNTSAIPALRSQQVALRTAHGRLQAELDQLQQLDTTLASNEQIIREAMLTADRVMDEAKRRKVPDVDEVLVAPTVVGGQLYTLCAEERAIGDTIFVLGRGLDRGRVGADVFIKQTRSLAREQFLKKALIKKIAKGMGLEDFEYSR